MLDMIERLSLVCALASVPLIVAVEKIGCAPRTLDEWAKDIEVDTGQRGGVTTEIVENMRALEREVRELTQASGILRKASA